MASEKENSSDGNEAWSLKRSKGQEWELHHNVKELYHSTKELHHNTKDAVSHQPAECPLVGDAAGDPAWPLSSKENVSGRLVPSGDERYSTPDRDKAGEKSHCGTSEKQRRKNIDFATVTTAEFGITPESFTNGSIGKSPAAQKLRRRSAIGARGSPENNALIQFLAQQRSARQKEASAQQASPFKFDRSLKSKLEVFQTSFKSIQEAEGRPSFSGLSQVSDASQEAGSSQNKAPLTKEHSLYQQSETFMSDYSGAGLKENLKQNLANGNKSDPKIYTLLSLHRDVSEPAAVSKEWTYKQHNPIEYLEAGLSRGILETNHDFSPDHISKEVNSNVASDLSRKKVNFAEELSLEIHDESKPPVTPLPMGNAVSEHPQNGSQLRSVLKKTPVKQLMGCMKENSDYRVDRGGSEPFTVSDHVNTCEALQAEKTEQCSPKKPKKKKVTFGEDLSPEIFDKTLPANTPLRKGGTPVRQPGSQSNSPYARLRLIEEPLTQPNFDCADECVEPLQELQEGSVVAEDPVPVENGAGAEADKSYMIATRSSTKRKCGGISEEIDCSISRATSAKNAKDTKNPRKNKLPRPKNIATSAAKKTQKIKHTTFGKRRKRKVKKPLYGEREMASKKPLLSPIPEVPEVFSSVSTPNSPKANTHFPDNSTPRNADTDIQQKQVIEIMREKTISAVHVYASSKEEDTVEASNSKDTVFQFPNTMPDTNYVFGTCDCFQQAEETACLKEKTQSDFLLENEKLQGNFSNKKEWQEFPGQQDTAVHEILPKPKISSRGRPPKRSSSTVYIPPIEKSHFEITGDDLQVSSFNVEEVLSVPQLKNNSLEEPFRRKNGRSSETNRVRRSMRLHKGAEMEGLAWIEVPSEILKNSSLLAAACKTRRSTCTSVLAESENIHHAEENLIQFAASGKENNDSVNADGPCKRWRRKSFSVSTARESRTWSQTRKRSITNSVYRKDRSNQRHSEEIEIPLENNTNT